MLKYILLLFILIAQNSFAQHIPAAIDSTLNAVKVRKTIYKDIELKKANIAPAHINASSVSLYRKELLLFSFNPPTAFAAGGDSTLLKKNPSYLHYALGQHGNKRGYYYQGKFETLDIHHAYLERDILGLDTCFVQLDTAFMITSRIQRLVFTQWKSYHPNDTGYHLMNVVFIFNKNNKLIRHFAYDNEHIGFPTSVGYFNKDELLDIVFYENKTTEDEVAQWHFSLYSLNKKGKLKEKKFHKAGHTIVIPEI